jgi:hypothetical protein
MATTNTKNEKNEKTEAQHDQAPADADGEEFQVTVKKLDLPVKPRGVLAE